MGNCDALLSDFLLKAPITQRSWLSARVHLLVLDGGLDLEADHIADLVAVLRDSDDLERPSWVVKIAAAIDHALLPFGPEQKNFLQFAADRSPESEQISLLLAQADLREKHLKQMRRAWSKLRGTSLSPEAVREFENMLHGPGQNRQ